MSFSFPFLPCFQLYQIWCLSVQQTVWGIIHCWLTPEKARGMAKSWPFLRAAANVCLPRGLCLSVGTLSKTLSQSRSHEYSHPGTSFIITLLSLHPNGRFTPSGTSWENVHIVFEFIDKALDTTQSKPDLAFLLVFWHMHFSFCWLCGQQPSACVIWTLV